MFDDRPFSKKYALAGLQCHKRLWWEMHDHGAEELRESPALRYRLREGTAVGALARSYVPGGLLIGGPRRSQAGLIAETRGAMATPNIPAIYEGAFRALETIVYTDILERTGNTWTLIEVKATTSVSDPEHLEDIAIQACVLRAAGVDVTRYEIMHLNRECRFPDLANLFTRQDVTEDVAPLLDEMQQHIAEQQRVVRLAEPPVVATGEHCSEPRDCAFMSRCWPPVPAHHVTTLYRIGRKAAGFVANGWEMIAQLPDDVKLSAIAARQRRAVRQGEVIVERDALLAALSALDRPVAHLDFETIQPAIPRWDGCRPYDQIPVQLSCHVVNADGSTKHHAWLFDGDGDPRPAAARAILDACRGARTVTAYFSSFEKECIKLAAAAAPELADELLAIANTIVDLLPIVREHVYHPEFAGSFSLKKVLPALVPALSYSGMRIAEGETAQLELSRLMFEREGMSGEERAEIRAALLDYCELDTKAMVALEQRLRELAQ
jgi:predicted RecB family nuclease